MQAVDISCRCHGDMMMAGVPADEAEAAISAFLDDFPKDEFPEGFIISEPYDESECS
jgi:hypothetical protein